MGIVTRFPRIRNQTIDRWFSQAIRLRDNYLCRHCGKFIGAGDQRLHCSHFYSRRHNATRWHPDNAFSHCYHCHRYLGENPGLFAEWALGELGEYRYNALRELHNVIIKRTAKEKKALSDHYRGEFRRMAETGARDLRNFDA